MAAKVITLPYDGEHYVPPAPVMSVEIDAPTRSRLNVTALIDSGSDGTLVPANLLEAIGARPVGEAIMTAIGGEHYAVQVYVVNVTVGSQRLPAIRVAAMAEGTEVVLGRDVLNQLTITLNGPALAAEVTE